VTGAATRPRAIARFAAEITASSDAVMMLACEPTPNSVPRPALTST
jgi:hypothetical protein